MVRWRAVWGMAFGLLCLALCFAAPAAACSIEETQGGSAGFEAAASRGVTAEEGADGADTAFLELEDGAGDGADELTTSYNMGGVLIDDHAHRYRLAEEAPATCEEAGSAVYVCEICGGEQTQILPALGHDWGDWETARHASLTSDGLRYRVCLHDAAHVQEQVLPQGITYELTPADAVIAGANVSVVSLFGVLMFRDLRVLRWDRRLRRRNVPWMKGGGLQ